MSVLARTLLLGALLLGSAQAAERPEEIVIDITAFLSGPASVFGEPAGSGDVSRAAA